MKHFFLVAALALLGFRGAAQITFSQGWSVWCEHEQNNLQQTTDGGYILCTDAVPEMDTVNNLAWCYLIKLDSLGIQQWAVQFPKSTYFIKARDGNAVTQTSDGGYAIATAMYTNNPSARTAIYVVKTNAMGGLLWSKTYPGLGNSSANCIAETADQDLLIAGYTHDTSSFNSYGYLLRITSTGTVVWGKHYDDPATVLPGIFHSASETSDSCLIAAGIMGSTGLVMKTDGSGNLLWTAAQVGNSENYDVMETRDGHFVSSGINYSTPGYASLIKLNTSGNPVWTYSYPRQGSATSAVDIAYAVEETDNGYTFSMTASQIWRGGLVHVDTAGQPQWAKLYTDSRIFHPIALEYTTDKGYAMCMSNIDLSSANFANWRINVLKVDSAGNAACNDSVIVDSLVALPPNVPMALNVVSVAPMVPIPTVLHYVLIADTNYCPGKVPEGVASVSASATLSIYPNPADQEVHIALAGLAGNTVAVRAFTATGQQISGTVHDNVSGDWSTALSTSAWAAGVYFLSVEIDGVRVQTEKLVVER
jgi:hypothetical protein